jgi:hypothetical protein
VSFDIHQGNHVGSIFGDDLKYLLPPSGVTMDLVNPELLVNSQQDQGGESKPIPLQGHATILLHEISAGQGANFIAVSQTKAQT